MSQYLHPFLDEIDRKFKEAIKSDPDFNTILMLEWCKDFFNSKCDTGADLDPRPTPENIDGNAIEANRLFVFAALKFVEIDRNFAIERTFAAEHLLFYGWSLFNEIQKEVKRKIYKGLIGFRLVILYQRYLKDLGAATRWTLLTHADDFLVGHTGMGAQSLRYTFGMSEKALSDFNQIIDQHKPDRLAGDWSTKEGFADDMLLKFALKYPQYAHLFASPTSVLEFPPCIPYLNTLRDAANSATPQDYTKKGNALEYLAAYLFLLIPGFLPRWKVVPKTKDFEHDLVVSNLRSSGNLEAEMFGRDFLVECKNWKSSVGVSEVGYFLYRMKLTHTKFGVIFAKSGISKADNGSKYAENLCQRAFHEDGLLCIVIEDNDIVNLLKDRTTFRSLLMEKVNHLRFGKPNSKRRYYPKLKKRKQA